jgi:hypothetical protein
MTFSLLPDCLAARLPGSLADVERVVAAVEAARSVEAAAEELRPEIELAGAIRWVRRRLRPVRAALLALVTMAVGGLVSCRPTLDSIGHQFGRPVLRQIRSRANRHLGALAAPIGFGPRPRRGGHRRGPLEHDMGPDPPPGSR